MITRQLLLGIMPHVNLQRLEEILPHLIEGCEKYEINNPLRENHFLAQLAHESGEFRYLRELASGDAYDTRTDLGNTPEIDGDGRKYKGRGLIQLMGATNYYKAGKALGADFLHNPLLLETPKYAALSACWFWWVKGLNVLADADNFLRITKTVNGGTNGIEQRKMYLQRAKKLNP